MKNSFPRRSRVKFHICEDPECRCGGLAIDGAEGIVISARGKCIHVDFETTNVMVVGLHFKKATAKNHLERLTA